MLAAGKYLEKGNTAGMYSTEVSLISQKTRLNPLYPKSDTKIQGMRHLFCSVVVIENEEC